MEPCLIFQWAGFDCPFKHDHEEEGPDDEREQNVRDPERVVPVGEFKRKQEGEQLRIQSHISVIAKDFSEAEQDRIPSIAAIRAREEGWSLPLNQSPLSIAQNLLIILTALALRKLGASIGAKGLPGVIQAQRQLRTQLSRPAGMRGGTPQGARGRGGFHRMEVLTSQLLFGSNPRKLAADEEWRDEEFVGYDYFAWPDLASGWFFI